MKPGSHLESFVKYVYTRLLELNDYKNVIVSQNVKIKGSSGAINEFDVYYEFPHLNFRCKVVIECKDWNYPVPIEEVRDFCEKINDVGSCQIIGAMVAKSGYQSGAITYANTKGIKLLAVDDLPNIYEIVAGVIKKSFLPDEDAIGDPFWTVMEVVDGHVTGNYLSLDKQLKTTVPTVPLFYSSKIAEKVLNSCIIDRDKYCVRGITQYQLRVLLSISELAGTKFALFYLPVINDKSMQTHCIILDAIDVKKNYYRE